MLAAYFSESDQPFRSYLTTDRSVATLARSFICVIHVPERRTYLHLVTLKKSESDFQPTTMYRDYPISRTRLHWESQSTLAVHHETARNYIEWKARGYTILFFVRTEKKMSGLPSPFIFLGPASDLVSQRGERPIAMVWDLAHPMPAALFEQAREGGG